jgi:hypothetical protein
LEPQCHPLGSLILTLSREKGNKRYALWGKALELHLTPMDSLRVNLTWSDLDHPSRAEYGKFGGGQAQLTRIDLDIVFSQTWRSPTAGSGIAAVR